MKVLKGLLWMYKNPFIDDLSLEPMVFVTLKLIVFKKFIFFNINMFFFVSYNKYSFLSSLVKCKSVLLCFYYMLFLLYY